MADIEKAKLQTKKYGDGGHISEGSVPKTRDDYATLAAREWFANTKLYIETTTPEDVRQAALDHLNASVETLAAVIRKHVADNIDDVNKSLMQS